MARYDEYKLKDLAKNTNIILSGNLFSDVDSIRAQYALDNAGTVDYPKRELSYDEAYRVLEFRKRYDSLPAETGADELVDFSVDAIFVVLIVAIILFVKFFKYPGKWLFVPVLSVVTLLFSMLSSYARMIEKYRRPLGKELSINFVKFYSWVSEQSFISGIILTVILSLVLTLLLYPITKKLNARIRKNFILTKGDKIGSLVFLISAFALLIFSFLSCLGIIVSFGSAFYLDDLVKVIKSVFLRWGVVANDFGKSIALWFTLFIAVYFLMLGIFFSRGKEKICAYLSLIFPLVFLSFEITRLFTGYPRYLVRRREYLVQFNSIFLGALSERGIYSEGYIMVAFLLIASLYFVFAGITLLKKSRKLYCFTRGLGHLVVLVHLVNLFVVEHSFSPKMSPWGLFYLGGFGMAIEGGRYSIYIPVRVAFFLIYVLLIWAVNMILAKKCDVNE